MEYKGDLQDLPIEVSGRLNKATLTEEEAKIINFIISYSFKDSKECYTNGSTLVPLYRVIDALLQKGQPYQGESPSPMEGKGLNLQKLSEKVDNALAKETKESLSDFFKDFKTEEELNLEGKTPLKGWVSVYRDKNDVCWTGNVWSSKEVCQDLADDEVIACIDLSKHYEGEGLS